MPRRRAWCSARRLAAWVLATLLAALTPASASATATAQALPQAKLNPTGRTLSLIVELRERDRPLGEVAIKIAPDDAVSVNKQQFVSASAPLLRDAAAAQLRAVPAAEGFVTLAALKAAGFDTRFDAANMRMLFTPAAEQRPRRTLRIQSAPHFAAQPEPPSRFSGYLNLSTATDYVSASPAGGSRFNPPRANIEAVLRWEDIIFETELTYDGGASKADHANGLSSLEGFSRRGTRIVRDLPDDALRVQAGDINPPVTSFQRGPDLLGVSVERSMRKLRPGENIRPTGERSFRITRPSTVKIELNGNIVRQLRLDPGEYDLTDLPLQSGANDIRLIIMDDLGEQRALEFTSYFDATLLAEDIYEWGFSAGALTDVEDGALTYQDDFIASGFYRRGLSPEITGEAHLQAGSHAAMAGAGLFTATPFGFFGIEGALSFHSEFGAGGALQIDWDALSVIDAGANLRLSADLRSRAFALPDQDDPLEDYWLSLLASYSRELPFGFHGSLSGRYAFAADRSDEKDAYSAQLGLSRAFGRDFGLSLTIQYSSDALELDGLDDAEDPADGELRAALRLSWRPELGTNVTARYETGDATASVSATRSVQRGIGSWTATVETIYDAPAEDLAADAGLTYVGNRALVSVQHTASLDATQGAAVLPAVNDQRTSLRVGTAIAFADGHVAVGRPIADGFAIIAPHESIGDRRILLGDRADPQAYNDALGPALVPDLGAYAPRNLRYDVDDLPVGYDLGTREFTLQPSYRAGYALTVGSAHSVTAFGTLLDAKGEPVGLVTGTATRPAGGGPKVNLFTNGAGRFAAQGLAPGRWQIEMATEPVQHFMLEIPEGTTGLYRAGTLAPEPQGEAG